MRSKFLYASAFASLLGLLFQCQVKEHSSISVHVDDQLITFEHENIKLIFDDLMYCKVKFLKDGAYQSMNHSKGTQLNSLPSHFITLGGNTYKDFRLLSHSTENIEDQEYGKGKRLILKGENSGIAKTCYIEMYEQFPDVAISWCTYTNHTGEDLRINKVYYNYYRLDRKLTRPEAKSYEFRYLQPLNKKWGDTWTNIGVTDSTNEDFYIPGMGSNRSGIPFMDIWSPEMGMAIFHVEGIPRFNHLIIKVQENDLVDIGFVTIPDDSYDQFPREILNDSSITTWKSAVCTHSNDFFQPGRRFGQLLDGALIKEGREGFPSSYPEQAYEPYWKTWGMNDLSGSGDFTIQEVKSKMNELADFGFKAIMLDDGWFDVMGNWNPDKEKFKNEQDLISFIQDAHKPQWGKSKDKSFKVYLWFDLLGTNTSQGYDHLLVRNRDGSLYENKQTDYAFCPSSGQFIDFARDTLLEKIINKWNVDGLYTDFEDQNPLPCFAEGHHHEYPSESMENNYEAFEVMYNKILERDSENGWIGMCACASVHDAYQYPYYFLNDAADPTSNKQVRWRTRFIKALRGPTAPAGDGYVDKMNYDNKAGEPAMSVATGNVITSLRWNVDELGGEEHARTWMDIYFKEKLYMGEYLGLYDIQYHKPEGYVIRKNEGTMYYAFFDEKPFDRDIELRGLDLDLEYEVIEYDTGIKRENLSGSDPTIHISSKPGNDEGEQVFYYVIKCIPN